VLAGAALVSVLWLFDPWSARLYVTSVGQQSTVKLDDGSMMYLNTDSRIQVHFTQHRRDLHLVQGEALFVVEHDSSRPFIVDSGDARVRAVGTQFNVRKRAGAITEVAVMEGVVQLTTTAAPDKPAAPAAANSSGTSARASHTSKPNASGSAATELPAGSTRLAAGQEARVNAGKITARVMPAPAEALAWRQRRLVFRDASLLEVAAEFNRYNQSHVRVETAEAQGKRLTGIFDADRPQALLLWCAQDDSLVVEPEGTNWVIRSR
jgi:transmembrane sensor